MATGACCSNLAYGCSASVACLIIVIWVTYGKTDNESGIGAI